MRERPEFSPRKTLILGSVILGLIIYSAYRKPPLPPNPSWSGPTMGTTYRIQIAHNPLGLKELKALRAEIEKELETLNQAMSTYIPDSEISRFNSTTSIAPVAVSPDFLNVMAYARQLSERSGGAFDVTVGPMIELWGFGHDAWREESPPAKAIEDAAARCGSSWLTISAGGLQKAIPGLRLDLSAVAKGYAVDRLLETVKAAGCKNAYVEIGGEIAVCGKNPSSRAWTLQLERPEYDSLPGESLRPGKIYLSDAAIATSGDYRNYFRDKGRVYSHIIDPRTGWPVTNHVASVTVVAPLCMVADGLATTVMVMGARDGLEMIESIPQVEALVIWRTEEGFEEIKSSGFQDIESAPPKL
jgi:thiamine biosynthesis lipoprotein